MEDVGAIGGILRNTRCRQGTGYVSRYIGSGQYGGVIGHGQRAGNRGACGALQG